MIHSQYSIKMSIHLRPEETVGRIRSERHYPFFLGLIDGRNDNRLFLAPQQTGLTGVRIENLQCENRKIDNLRSRKIICYNFTAPLYITVNYTFYTFSVFKAFNRAAAENSIININGKAAAIDIICSGLSPPAIRSPIAITD